MEPADTIGRIGFQRWYERRLLESHAWLVTCLLCLFVVLACFEELSFRGPVARLLGYTIIVFAAGTAGIYAMVAYLNSMARTLHLGEHATCAGCGTYARFRMISQSHVRCRKCDNEWRLID